MATRLALASVVLFFLIESVARVLARHMIEPGATVHIAGGLYLANATNSKSVMAFGLSSLSWLLIALSISCCFLLLFWVAGSFIPQLQGGKAVPFGIVSGSLVVAVILINIFETLLIGGVTDYLAWINVEAGTARIVNLADVVLILSLFLVMASYLMVLVVLTKVAAANLIRVVQ